MYLCAALYSDYFCRSVFVVVMRAVVQRVTSAKVAVNGEVVSSIRRGLCVLIGLAIDDDQKDIDFMVRKLVNLRVFESEEKKKWDKSIANLNLEILCVSQFTLLATLKGHKPDYRFSMGPDKAPVVYQQFIDALKKEYVPELVKDGIFGAYMQVSIENDGPVTIIIDSKKNESSASLNELAGKDDDEQGKFKCPMEGCDKQFPLAFNLRTHLKSHDNETYPYLQ